MNKKIRSLINEMFDQGMSFDQVVDKLASIAMYEDFKRDSVKVDSEDTQIECGITPKEAMLEELKNIKHIADLPYWKFRLEYPKICKNMHVENHQLFAISGMIGALMRKVRNDEFR